MKRLLTLAALLACGALTRALYSLLPARDLSLTLLGASFELLEPRFLCALGLLPLLSLAAVRSARGESRGRRALTTLWRCLLLVLLITALGQPQQRIPTTTGETILLVDVSDSVEPAFLQQTARRIAQLCEARGAQQLTLVTFARLARQVPFNCQDAPPLLRHADGSQSDLAAAIDLGLGLLDARAAGQLVLFSDGLETLGDSQGATERAARAGVRLLYEAPARSDSLELGVLSLSLPNTVKAGEPFAISARVFATHTTRTRVTLSRDGKPEPDQPPAAVALPAGESTLSFRARAGAPGSALYRLELTPEGPDRSAANNRLERSLKVLGKPRVLYVEREREQAVALRSLLEAAGFEVSVASPEGAPRSAAALRNVDFYILSDVPNGALPEGASSAIASFLEQGGGFLMAGGEQSLGLGGYAGSQLARLLPVSLEHKQPHEEPTLALSLVIDKSGSMSDEKIALAKEAARATAALLREDDYLGVIGFDAAPTHVVRLSAARNRSAIERGIERLKAGGGTAIFPALDAAYADLSGVRARKKHVILLTDGQTREAGLDVLVQNMQLSDITLSTVGLGQDVSRKLLEDLARLGHGRSYFTDDPRHVPRLFLHDTEAVSRSSVVEQPVMARLAAPASFLKGVNLADAPPLAGYVATTARPSPAQLVLQTSSGDPLLARVRVGLGWSLAFTSDLKPRWASDWFRWRDFSRLIAQLIREHMRQVASDALAIRAHVEHGALLAELEVLDDAQRFVNDLVGELTLTRDADALIVQRAPLKLVAPGLYQARLKLPPLASYSLNAQMKGDGRELAAFGTLGHVLPEELRRLTPDLAHLQRLARQTRGGPLRGVAQLRQGLAYRRVRQPRWSLLVWAALLGFVAELALRRLGPTRSAPTPLPDGPNPVALRDN